MAINYTKIGWDTTKYVNPTNMNNMDNGIKAACDGVDDINSKYLPKAGGTMTGNLAISVPNAHSPIILGDLTDTSHFGYLLMARSAKYMQISPKALTANRTIECPDESGTIALAENVVKLSAAGAQTITTKEGHCPCCD